MTRNIKVDVNIHPADWDIRYFCHQALLDGTIACLVKHPIGGNIDDPGAEVGPPVGALAETVPMGMVMQEFVKFDNTRMTMDMSDFELKMAGGKAALVTRGGLTVRTIADPPETRLSNKTAYYDMNGFLTTEPDPNDTSPPVGRFLGERDAEGYAYVMLSMPTYNDPARALGV